jgi:HlyD family secretion protein
MKKILALVLVLGIAGGGWWWWSSSSAPAAEKKLETRRAKVERGDLVLWVEATGEIKPEREVELKSKASGRVMQFRKLPGDPVEENELIAELDKRTEERNLGLQEANLLTAEANLEITRLKYAADLKTSESELAGAREDEKQKVAELRRMEKLSGELVTESELSTVRLAARLAEERSKQTEAALTLARSRKEADEKLALADVHKARVTVEDAKERLRDTEVRAPIKGILLKKLVEEGQIVASGVSATTGGTAVAIVADVSRLMVEANVDETDITKVRKGHPADITLVTGTSEKFKGSVNLLLPKGELDSNVMVFKVRVGIEGQIFGRAYAGMTASVRIKVDERKQVLIAPSAAFKQERKGWTAQVPDGTGSKSVPVKTGLDTGEMTEVVSGLDENAEVLISYSPIPDVKMGGGRRRGGMGF